jgi:hypothetical protein
MRVEVVTTVTDSQSLNTFTNTFRISRRRERESSGRNSVGNMPAHHPALVRVRK